VNVFISWSEPTSQQVAGALRDWLPLIIQSIKPFMSKKDINAGLPWSEEISSQLGTADCGIVCITPANVRKPWLLYEAGAIAGRFDRAIYPLLINVEPNEFTERGGPLTQFQSRTCDKDGLRSLLHAVNQRQSAESLLKEDLLDKQFDRWWDVMEASLKGTDRFQDGETSTEYDWLLSVRDFTMLPDWGGDSHSFWMITPDVSQSTRNRAMFNWEKNHYVFITKDTQPNADADKRLRKLAGDKVRFNRKTNVEDYEKLVATNYIIIDPDTNPRAYLELPVAEAGLWIKVDDRAVQNFVNRFSPLAAEAI